MLEPLAARRLLSKLVADVDTTLAQRLDAGHLSHLAGADAWAKDKLQGMGLESL